MLGKDIANTVREIFLDSIQRYFKKNLSDISLPKDLDLSLQVIKDKQYGDLSSNIAMRLASTARRSPIELAEGIASVFNNSVEKSGLTSYIRKIEAKKGFINLWLSDEYYHKLLANIKDEGKNYGRSKLGKGKRVNLEFVSANPTGPLTIAHGRQAAIGDSLSRILKFNGYDVTSEYYLNDFGRQIKLLGESVEVRYRNLSGKNEAMPEDGYMGDYIIDIAGEIKDKKGDTLLEKSALTEKFFREYAVSHMMGLITKDLDDFGVEFDVWTSQAKIEEDDKVGKILSSLKEKGHIYEDEGATWFASSRLGDDKDRVVIKSDGSYTYLAPDIAYHNDKYRRGYDWLIDLLGPDHHGYIRRMKAAAQALGHDAKSLDILIVQLVTLFRGGEMVRMSTRKAEFISLREVLDELGKDVTRFFFLMRKLDSHLDFDIELAKKESSDNPVFYIQYAHARICSINRFGKEKKSDLALKKTDLTLLKTEQEKDLIRKLSEFPLAATSSAETLEPNKLIVYLNELAREFHSFYTECRVVSDDLVLTKARFFLIDCARIVLSNGLGLLNITLPEKM